MTHQKSEDCDVPEGRRKPSQTRGIESPGGGKAVPVKEVDQQLLLAFATTESPRSPAEPTAQTPRTDPRVTAHEVSKAKAKQEQSSPATMEEVVGTPPHPPGCPPATRMATCL